MWLWRHAGAVPRTLGIVLWLFLLGSLSGWAQVTGEIGPYQVELVTEPAVIPVGKARLVLKVSHSGKPLEGATVRALTGMPGMKMGEKEETARPRPGQPGVYEVSAAFPMGGEYRVSVSIEAPAGKAQGALALRTGQKTDTEGGGAGGGRLLWLLIPAVLLLGWVGYRMWRTGQRPEWSTLKDRNVLGSLALLALMAAAAVYAVRNFRRPGAMTPIEAQVMDMNMPAPSGTLPVRLARVERGTVSATVRYSGQVVGYDEPSITARVSGIVEYLPVYPGDRVRRGQILARLETTEIEPQLEERAAGQRMREQRVVTARAEAGQAQAMVSQEQARLRGQSASVDEAGAQVREAQAALRRRQAELVPQREQYRRSRALLAEGAVSQEEFEKDRGEWQAAEAMVAEARASLGQTQAQWRQARAELSGQQAAVRSAQQGVTVRQAQIEEAQAEAEGARASLRASQTQQEYATLRAPVDGIVTKRLLSRGALVKPGDALLQIAQLDPIRLQANVAAQDLARIQVGDPVKAFDRLEGKPVSGKVTSVHPALESTSRTGIVETVMPNPNTRFLPGAFVTLEVAVDQAEDVLFVPSEAVVERNLSPESVRRYVWLAEPEGEAFTARQVEVQIGPSDGRRTAVTKGLQAGAQVIAEGHRFLKSGDTVQGQVEAHAGPITIEVTAQGYRPAQVSGVAGQPLELTFIRRVEETCATELVFPEFNLKKPLPLNQAVTVELTPKRSGTFRFTCGMDMFNGQLVVK